MFQAVIVQTVTVILRSLLITACLVAGAIAGEPVPADPVQFTIDKQPLGDALAEFARQSDREILFSTEVVEDKDAPLVVGEYEPEDALELLLADTGLEYSVTPNDTILVTEEKGGPDPGNARTTSTAGRMAQASGERDRKSEKEQDEDRQGIAGVKQRDLPIEEIVVTGTHIRGANSISPIHTFDRQDIDRTGYANLSQFLVALPQNFGGGANENSAGGTAAPRSAPTEGTGVNIRGLGNDSTLTLLNGRRLAPSGFGDFVDLSLIPLIAIERVDVLTDGASAIYGSDAIGGVVNITLRSDFNGAQTRLRMGQTSRSDGEEYQAGQVWGRTWNTGDFISGFEFYRRDPVDSSNRPFTVDAPDPLFLLPQQKRNSLFASLNQQIGSGIDLFGNVLYAQRDYAISTASPVLSITDGKARQLSTTMGVRSGINESWTVEGALAFSRSESVSTTDQLGVVLQSDNTSSVVSSDIKVDGKIAEMPGGQLRAAFGGQYRREAYDTEMPRAYKNNREVVALFGELHVPLIGENNRHQGMERVEITAAIRHEDYTELGSTTNPKFGLLWSPNGAINVRSTYGRSFRAPNFKELNTSSNVVFLVPVPDPALGGSTPAIIPAGNLPNTRPERAETWTAGFDFSPEALPQFEAELSYFSIRYRDRIENPISNFFTVLGNIEQFAPLAFRNPDIETIQIYVADPNFLNLCGCNPSEAGAFIDLRIQNTATTKMQGVDASFRYAVERPFGTFTASINGQYITKIERQSLPNAPVIDTVDTVYNPLALRLRGSLQWSREPVSVAIFANYSGKYTDDRIGPSTNIDRWTTIDANASYELASDNSSGFMSGTKVSVVVINMFDRDPPFIRDPATNLHFDGANANALGRFIAVQIVKSW